MTAKLGAANIFFIAQRDAAPAQIAYYSFKVAGSLLVLLEITSQPGRVGPGTFISEACVHSSLCVAISAASVCGAMKSFYAATGKRGVFRGCNPVLACCNRQIPPSCFR